MGHPEVWAGGGVRTSSARYLTGLFDGYGVEGVEEEGFGGGFLLLAGFFAGPVFHEDLFEVLFFADAGLEVLFGGDEAVVGVEFDRFDRVCGVLGGLAWGEVDGRDLEAVEEEAGAAGIELVGGEAEEDFSDGGLDGRTVVRAWEVEGGSAGLAGLPGVQFRFWDGFAGGVVVVAEGFAAQGWAAAAVARG